ncbi:cytochrome c oxidase assembly protein COX18, mitochondrial [Colletes gigas]|uniref:cytochrome c oxidase assembly protein COX18, mitochondrial n=1 Tax=Colletes gigas TaxID=935657 RepID=UPI001C9B5C7A|nr:cytochrome c oxidase assembly protein COX18, mitochondrial [Colletes gigas]
MIARIFQKLTLDFKHSNSIFMKYHSINDRSSNVSYRNLNTHLFSENKVLLGYSSNEQNFSKTPGTPLQRTVIPIVNGPLCSQNNTILPRANSINHFATVNSIRQYSDSTLPLILNKAVVYNNGIVKIISESYLVECIMDALRAMHHNTGLPWWATIILTTLCARTFITLPLAIHQLQVRAKLENLQHEMKPIAEKLKMEARMAVKTLDWSPSYATSVYNQNVSKEWKELIIKENCHPLKIVVMGILQMPVWVGFSFALRNICFMLPYRDEVAYQDYLEFTNGGFGWMQNLIEMDHSFMLPIIFGFTGLALIEIQNMLYKENNTKFRRILTNFFRIITVCLVPIMAYIPSCLTLFWTSNNVYALSQTLLLLSPKIRRLGRIPKTDSELQHPYAELYKSVKQKLHLERNVAKQ